MYKLKENVSFVVTQTWKDLSPWGINPQTVGFHTLKLYQWDSETLQWAEPLQSSSVILHTFRINMHLNISLTFTGCKSTPYISNHLILSRYINSATDGTIFLEWKKIIVFDKEFSLLTVFFFFYQKISHKNEELHQPKTNLHTNYFKCIFSSPGSWIMHWYCKEKLHLDLF